MADKIIDTTTAQTMLGDDGIVRVRMIPGTRETLETARENIAAFLEICAGDKVPVLVNLTGTLGASKAARHLYSSDYVSHSIVAMAMIVSSPVTEVMANFFLTLNKPHRLLRLFSSETDAIEWLKGYRL